VFGGWYSHTRVCDWPGPPDSYKFTSLSHVYEREIIFVILQSLRLNHFRHIILLAPPIVSHVLPIACPGYRTLIPLMISTSEVNGSERVQAPMDPQIHLVSSMGKDNIRFKCRSGRISNVGISFVTGSPDLTRTWSSVYPATGLNQGLITSSIERVGDSERDRLRRF